MHLVRMPMMGNTMEIGVVVEWCVDEGDTVTKDDVVVIVESEKSSMDVTANQDGALARSDVKAGEEVPPGTLIGVILGPDEDIADAPAPRSRKQSEGKTAEASEESSERTAPDQTADESTDTTERDSARAAGDESDQPVADQSGQQSDSESSQPATASAEQGVFASPTTRREARRLGITIEDVAGTDPGGRITLADVRTAAGQNNTPAGATESEPTIPRDSSAPTSDRVTVTEQRTLSGIRKTIAQRMASSHANAPHVTLTRDVPVQAPLTAADELSEEAANVGFMDLLIAAVARAFEDHPEFNAWFDGDNHRLIAEANVAVAVDTDAGLLTPVISQAGGQSVSSIASERARLTEKVLNGEHDPADLQDGTFTITNLGMFGIDSFDPIINPPQVAILGIGRITDGEDGPACTFNLSFDHRVVDGADAARFLDILVDWLSTPLRLVTAQLRRASGETASTGPTMISADTVSGALARRIEQVASDIAEAHDWSVTQFSADVSMDDELSVSVSADGESSPATVRRLTYTACREVGQEMALDSLFDPAVSIDTT